MRAPPQRLLGARSLADWIRAGAGHSEPLSSAYRMRLWWHAKWFEVNWQAETRRLETAALPDNPVFVLGPWRSGTTVLHELLAACARWVTPETWQCFNPSTCFLSGPPAVETVASRPMDQGRIATRGPQEDEFALLLLGEPSVYRGFIDPRRLRECGELLWSGHEGPLPRWQIFVRGIAAASPGSRLLLKSPNHTFRLPLLRTLFPRAQFIWVGRQPGEVLASNERMWSAMVERYALWDGPPGVLEGFLRDMVRSCAAVLRQCLDDMPPSRMLWIGFEQLHARPKETLQRVLRFVDLGATPDEGAIERAVSSIPIHAGSRAPLPDDRDARELQALMSAARQRFEGLST